ncbi:hypothetical protein [Sorangium sp. So ce131]|uniref:hypothetical protein n=1 Tax=Sorangium sp. So ce131 TaxID=3133282 RepID=UPI003F623891
MGSRRCQAARPAGGLMDVYCEVCGIVTSVSGDARGGGARACWACGTTLRAHGRGAAGPPAGVEERAPVVPAPDLPGPSRPPAPRDDEDPTMIDLRSLALKSFLATLPARNHAAGAPAPLVAVDAPPSVSDVLRVYDALAPIAAPPRARRAPRLRVLLAASAAGALALAVVLALVAGHRSRARARATGSAVLPDAQRGLAPVGELARSVKAPGEAQGRAAPSPRAPEAPAPEAPAPEAPAPELVAGSARSSEAAAAPRPRAEVKPGGRGASVAGDRARSARRPSTAPAPPPAPPAPPALEAPRPPPPVSLADALAAAVAERPPKAAPAVRPREEATE